MNIEKLIKNAKFLIFDFDGTIANTSPLHEAAFQKIFKPFNISINYYEIAGKSTKEAIVNILGKNKLKLDTLELDNLIIKKQSLVREQIKYSSHLNQFHMRQILLKKHMTFIL